MRYWQLVGLGIAACVMTFPGTVAAQQEEYAEALLIPDGETPVSIEITGKSIAEDGVNAMSGDVQINEVQVDVDYSAKFKSKMPLTFSFNIQHVEIDSSVPVQLPSRLEGRSIGVSAKVPLPFVAREGYYLGIDLEPTMNTDDGEWEDSAFRMPMRIYGIYKESDQLILVLGMAIRPDYETTLVPLAGFIYEPNDRLAFNFASVAPDITYKLSEHLDAVLEFDYDLAEYEVTRNGQDGVILKYRSAGAGVGVRYHYEDTLSFALSVGAEFNRRFEYDDGIGKVEPDAAPYIKGSLSLLF